MASQLNKMATQPPSDITLAKVYAISFIPAAEGNFLGRQARQWFQNLICIQPRGGF